MKRSKCKKLLTWGIVLVAAFILLQVPFIGISSILTSNNAPTVAKIIGIVMRILMVLLPMGFVLGIIFIIIAAVQWNSEERAEYKKERIIERKEIHKAQINAIKRGKINVELKGKMRKLG